MNYIKLFLLKDVKLVGMAGEIVKVRPGYAANFLIPRKLGIEITKENEASLMNRQKVVERRKEVIATETSMLAEKVRSTTLILKGKVHGDESSEGKKKLYGAISSSDIVNAFAQKGIKISKNQVQLEKAIKTTGSFEVVIHLSQRLQPKVTVKVIAESEA